MTRREFVFAIFALIVWLVGMVLACFTIRDIFHDRQNSDDRQNPDTAYALLYDDGTLVFQRTSMRNPFRGAVTNTYEVDLTKNYGWDKKTKTPNTPWYNEREGITAVNFASRIAPISTAYWFHRCENLTQINNLKRLDTSNVTDMSWMFYYCKSLTTLDVSGFDTSNVTDMSYMFNRCYGLKTIYASDSFVTDQVTDSLLMFYDTTSLVGGNGTTYGGNHTDKEYARIDRDGAPGYFTRKS